MQNLIATIEPGNVESHLKAIENWETQIGAKCPACKAFLKIENGFLFCGESDCLDIAKDGQKIENDFSSALAKLVEKVECEEENLEKLECLQNEGDGEGEWADRKNEIEWVEIHS